MDTSRHTQLFDASKIPGYALVVGIGSIGSRLALHLAELGILGAVVDPDTVESHNVANQVYGIGDVGRLKAIALKDILKAKTGHSVDSLIFSLNGNTSILYKTVACCVDTMEDRESIFDGVANNKYTTLYIDCRMTATGVMVYILDPQNATQAGRYRETLYPDSEVLEESGGCGLQQTLGATAQIAASIATARLIQWVMGGRQVFETLYDWKTGLYMEQTNL